MSNKEYYLYVKGKAVPVTVSEEVYKAYWKITEHEKYLQRKDWKHNVILFSALDHDGHFVDNIIDEKIDLEKIVEVKMQIEELHKALNTLTKEERELMEAIFYKEESLRSISRREKVTHQAISGRRDRILEKLRKILEDKI
ncbi:sigma-70 family RNA polymerase sigma factor [Streptococcus anginosus]|nr:sigma-70 family RNA polymerase sigma factor [Streptococcus anginosus]MED5938211.1 sigma-70 family RNA polymerase sigma factor [Streptococcus anginosus]MED5978475.1 sigma-70 family RNA polymerase sigma factor [Streptococcus anginosus]